MLIPPQGLRCLWDQLVSAWDSVPFSPPRRRLLSQHAEAPTLLYADSAQFGNPAITASREVSLQLSTWLLLLLENPFHLHTSIFFIAASPRSCRLLQAIFARCPSGPLLLCSRSQPQVQAGGEHPRRLARAFEQSPGVGIPRLLLCFIWVCSPREGCNGGRLCYAAALLASKL